MNIAVRYGFSLIVVAPLAVSAQPYGPPDRDHPGDEMIQAHLSQLAKSLDAKFADDVKSLADWERNLPRYREEYLYMLGLWPLPEKTPLQATVTGRLDRDGYLVEKLHYQSRPGLYVTANLYRPATTASSNAERRNPNAEPKLPAVLYVCGHSNMGRNGNKANYQAHGIWLAKHGYLCLTVDSLQLGEIGAIHHGTYRENRWWWHSRGYTSAGVECWNGIRGIDYLLSRPDVDPQRIAVTGISGGGAATFWIAAADERVQVAVPVSGMADLESYVGNRVINGHCDCMFLYNTFEWPWTRIAGLIAPRPMLFTNSDNDRIFPMDANERISNRLERLYSLYGAGDRFDTLVSVGGHAYRADLRQGIFRFLNTHLKGDPAIITDAERDLVNKEDSKNPIYPIAPEDLRAFATDADLPKDQLNTTIDETFVPLGEPKLPTNAAEFATFKDELKRELKRVSFRPLPESVPPAKAVEELEGVGRIYETEPGIRVVTRPDGVAHKRLPAKIVLYCSTSDDTAPLSAEILSAIDAAASEVMVLQPRGTGRFRWTQRNPPNYVARSHVLLGRTIDGDRVRDIVSVARSLQEPDRRRPVQVAGEGGDALLAAYAALWSDDIAGVIAINPPASHHAPDAPQFLNILRVADVPVILGALAPKPMTLIDASGEVRPTVERIYRAAGAELK